ncbi:hypothetical protein [Haliangium sp.]|uniref:hypothetical protein n=1 Tax=Haliangium sp. TaxID=2663208 RepID=UPI003D1157B9
MDRRTEPPLLDTTTVNSVIGCLHEAAMSMEPLLWDGDEAVTPAEIAAALVALDHVRSSVDAVLPLLRAMLQR